MPVHDYFCEQCGQVILDVLVPIAIGQRAGAPRHCGQPASPIPGIGRMDYGAVKGVGFKGFTTTDGRGNPVHIDSLRKLRQVERESEQMARDGVGQPMVWRRYAQNLGNEDQPTLSKNYYGGDAPSAEGKAKYGRSTLKTSTEAPDSSYGPGVTDSNASALPMESVK